MYSYITYVDSSYELGDIIQGWHLHLDSEFDFICLYLN